MKPMSFEIIGPHVAVLVGTEARVLLALNVECPYPFEKYLRRARNAKALVEEKWQRGYNP